LPERRGGTLECRRLAEQDAIGTYADLVGSGTKWIGHRENDRKAGPDHQSLSMHGDIPRDEEIIADGGTLKLPK
jgi:hypothetical protein